MTGKCKIIANYLPQYHAIPENDKWWGKGFTDWVVTKKAKPLFNGHNQPRVPLNNNYYDLSMVSDIKWQVKIAREHGIYGFGIYHYWFNSDLMLLEKPSEIILHNKDIDINYMFIWDNSSWVRTWSSMKHSNQWIVDENEIPDTNDNGILAELIYGAEEDWKKHYEYLSMHFHDDRYIKVNNKPMFVIFNPGNNNDVLCKMVDYWNKLAIDDGYDGVFIVSKRNYRGVSVGDYEMTYEPGSSMTSGDYFWIRLWVKTFDKINKILRRPNIYQSYDAVWKRINRKARQLGRTNTFFSGFVDFDDTPRRGKNARIILGSTPMKFYKYLTELLSICNEYNKEFLFITAWNEWGEGAYLEPDTKNGFGYLDAIKKAVEDNDD